MSFGFSNDYRRIGTEVPFGEVLVGYDDVIHVKDAVLGNFMDNATTKRARVDGTLARASVLGSLYIAPIGDDVVTSGKYFGAKVA